MRRKTILVAALMASLASPAGVAGQGGDPLPVVARSPDEAARVAAVTALPRDFTRQQAYEANPGGAATARAPGDPLMQVSPALPLEAGLDFELGRALFDKPWGPAPSSTRASDGLGPLFNARSCAGCHPGNGRGAPPDGAGDLAGFVVKLSVPADPDAIAEHLARIEGWHATQPDPYLGAQLQDRAAPGLAPEGSLSLFWAAQSHVLGTETVVLRRALVSVDTAGPDTRLSPRVAPPLIGLGLLEAIPEADLRALADPDDVDGDGISGRLAMAWSPAHQQALPGRFGARASVPSLRDMVGQALSSDMGLSSPDFPDPAGDCTLSQDDCRAAPHGADPGLRDGQEVSGTARDAIVDYVAHLAVPPRAADPGTVLSGKALFHEAGCADCHHPSFVTNRLAGDPARSFQLIWPYSDLLLHDMGPGLADAAPDGVASAREWRTAPLWGLSRNTTGTWLHDGRARSLHEAIAWHGGEAQSARDRYAAMAPGARAALIEFLESL